MLSSGYRSFFVDIKKYENRDAGDVYVKWNNNTHTLFEVKQESVQRIEVYHEYGLDLVSAIAYKGKPFDKGVHNILSLKLFLDSLDVHSPSFKWGKLSYSHADAWLFYAKDNDGYGFISVYSFEKIKQDKDFFKKAIDAGSEFAINNKPYTQMSCNDHHQSAVLYVPIDFMESYRVNELHEIQHGNDMMELLYDATGYAKERNAALWN